MMESHQKKPESRPKLASKLRGTLGRGSMKAVKFTHRQFEKPIPFTKNNEKGISRYIGTATLAALLVIGEKGEPFERLGDALENTRDTLTSEIQQRVGNLIHPEIWGNEPSHERDANIEAFIDQYGQYAEMAEDTHGVPADVSLAMGVLESAYGESDLAQNAYNFHGLKANNEWTGQVYEKHTKEHLTKEQMNEVSVVGEPTPLSDGYYEVTVVDKFKQFTSAEEGFMHFAEYLKNRSEGRAYADAFDYGDDPYEFMAALFDSEGYKYATDIEYLKKAIGILDKITGKSQPVENEQTLVRAWESLSAFEQRAIGDLNNYQKTVEQLTLASVSPDGYREFVNSIVDETAWVNNRPQNDRYKLFPDPDKNFEMVDNPRITLHFTAWQSQEALGYGGRQFIDSVANAGYLGSANAYIALDGTMSVFTRGNQASYHAGPEYNKETFGIEIPASNQQGVTAEQYAHMAYAVAWRYRENYPDKKPSRGEMNEFVVGHGEITEVKGIGDHTDIPLFVADAVAGLAHNLLQDM